jgi:hypothetical protein
VARHDRPARIRQLAIDNVKIGAANAAGFNPDPDLARPGRGIGPLFQRERPAGSGKDHGLHGRSLLAFSVAPASSVMCFYHA